MIATEDLSLSEPLSNDFKIKEDGKNIDNMDSNNEKQMEIEKTPESPKRIQVPHTSSEFLTAWVDKLQANALSSLYILPFRELDSNDFIKLFNAIANCTSLNILTISGHDFGPECHSALTRALSTNASIITLEIGSNVLGLCSEEIENISYPNTAYNTGSNISEINESGSSTPTTKKESSLSALLSGSSTSIASSSTEFINANSNECLNHANSDMTLVPPSPPSYSDSNSYKQYSTSTPNIIHQVSSALSRNLKSYTQTQNYLNNSKGVFNQHKMNIAKNHPYLNSQNPILPSSELSENNVNEPDNLESFKAICTGIGMNQSIQHWNLDYKSIGFRAAEILADRVLLCNETLVKLSLARNHLGDKGCITLCQALIESKNSTLRYLNLKDNDIGAEGMGEKGIAGLLKACFHDDTIEDINSSPFDFNTTTPSSSYTSQLRSLAMTPLTLNKPKSEKNVTINDNVEIEMTTPYINIDSASSYGSYHGHRHSNSGSGLLSTSYSSTISNASSCSSYTSSHSHCGIRELDLSCNPIGDEGGVLIGEALKYNVNLRELNLCNTDIGDDTLISICKSIEYTLTPNIISEDPTESPPRCSRIQHSSRLLKLTLNKNHIRSKGCEALGKLLEKNPRLCSISLNENLVGDEGVRNLVRPLMINKYNSLNNYNSNSLALNSTSPTSPKMMGIPINKKDNHYGSNVSSCSSFNSINGWAVPGVTTKSPASIGSNGNSWNVFGVHSLSFSNDGNKSPSDTDWTKYNSNGLSMPDATGSYLEGNAMNFNSSNSSTHCKNTHLTSLYLSANNITMKGFIDLIQSCPALKLLDLHKNNISLTEKDDFSTVIKKFGLNKLQELYLSDNSMGVTDLKLICNMLHSGLSPKLQELSLTGNVSLYDDEAYEEWEEKITQLEIERPLLSITWR